MLCGGVAGGGCEMCSVPFVEGVLCGGCTCLRLKLAEGVLCGGCGWWRRCV